MVGHFLKTPPTILGGILLTIILWSFLIVWNRRFLDRAYQGEGVRIPPEIPVRSILIGWFILLLCWGITFIPSLPFNILYTIIRFVLFLTGITGIGIMLQGGLRWLRLIRSHIVCLSLHALPLPTSPALRGVIEFNQPPSEKCIEFQLTIHETVYIRSKTRKTRCRKKVLYKKRIPLNPVKNKQKKGMSLFSFSLPMNFDVPIPGIYIKESTDGGVEDCSEQISSRFIARMQKGIHVWFERKVLWEFLVIRKGKPWIRFYLLRLKDQLDPM